MDNKYIFVPKNPILRHCSDSLFRALKKKDDNSTLIHAFLNVGFKSFWHLLQKVIKSKSSDSFSFFFLAVQSDYLVVLFLLTLVAKVLTKNIKVYYLMHEPRLEKGQVNPVKSFTIFAHQFLFGHLADVIILPSDEAVAKAETFVEKDKICKINLAFLSVPQSVLEKNLQQLKCSWENCKTFSMLGTASSLEKNPQGFLDFATIFNQLCPRRGQFIRGGRDRGIQVQYDEDIIIRFPSYLSDTAKGFLFNLSHFVIVPYSFSTQSGVLTEALSHGKLLIISDIPAFSHFKELDFVISVNFNDRESILECVENISTMNFYDYETRYWAAAQYFQENHSEAYLSSNLSAFL
jgi:glycosyltransferase involved in cell wall biosynthesis